MFWKSDGITIWLPFDLFMAFSILLSIPNILYINVETVFFKVFQDSFFQTISHKMVIEYLFIANFSLDFAIDNFRF